MQPKYPAYYYWILFVALMLTIAIWHTILLDSVIVKSRASSVMPSPNSKNTADSVSSTLIKSI